RLLSSVDVEPSQVNRADDRQRQHPPHSPNWCLDIGRCRDVALLRAGGLLERPYRHLSGYRAYPIAAVNKVETIKRAEALGSTLAELREMLRGPGSGLLGEQAAKKQ